MRQRELKKLKAMLVKLTFGQRRDLLDELAAENGAAASVGIIEHAEHLHCCPHCSGERMARNGSASGLQRYKCRDCGRTFNALTGTPLARLRQKSKWLTQSEVLRDGVTITQAAKRLKVARSTAFRWRHRFMSAPKTIQAQSLVGIAEADGGLGQLGTGGVIADERREGGDRVLEFLALEVDVADAECGVPHRLAIRRRHPRELLCVERPLVEVDCLVAFLEGQVNDDRVTSLRDGLNVRHDFSLP